MDIKINFKMLNQNLTQSLSNKKLINYMESIGKIDSNTDLSYLTKYINHKSPDVRCLVIKNIAKTNMPNLYHFCANIYQNDNNTTVRREAISAIGRQKKYENIELLTLALKDNDPKIICQAVRALLVFKGDSKVDIRLKKLINHDNEMVRDIIKKEYCSVKQNNKNDISHSFVDKNLKNTVVLGDVLNILDNVKSDSIHLTFTSPPYYNARDYSIYPSYSAYLEFLREVFEKVYRVTKKGRFLIVNTSPIIVPRISRQHSSKRYPIPFDLHSILAKIGWEFIDDIVWEKPEYSVKNRNGGFMQHRKPLAYKPNTITEYLMVYRKKTDKLIDWNIKQYDFNTVEKSKVKDDFETTNIWKIHPKADKVHSAIFPIELCERVISYYSFEGDIVFDPFAGSGTLGRTAKMLNRNFFLTEIEKKYFNYIKQVLGKKTLFDNNIRFLEYEEFKNIGVKNDIK
jgi:DNA modification methylase